MYVGKTFFAQVMEFVPWTSFARIVQRHGGNSGMRTLSCAEQFRAMAFAQLTWRESLRDIEASLSANASALYAMGFRSAVRRSALADANESRNWPIWSAGPARCHPRLHPHQRRQAARRERAGRAELRGRCVLRDGSAMSISPGSMHCTRPAPISSLARSRRWMPGGPTRHRRIAAPASSAISK